MSGRFVKRTQHDARFCVCLPEEHLHSRCRADPGEFGGYGADRCASVAQENTFWDQSIWLSPFHR